MFLHNGRYDDIHKVVAGFKQTGIPLVMADGTTALPYDTQGADDIGIYLFIPKLARLFNLTADQAIILFFYGIFATALFFAIVGFFLLYKTIWQRLIALCGTISTFMVAFTVNDVYIISHLLAFCCIPLFIYYCQKNNSSYSMMLLLFLMGIMAGFSNYLRAHAGWGVLLFVMTVLMFYQCTRFKRIVCFIALLLGMSSATGYIYYNYYQYHQYAQHHFDHYPVTTPRHTFWHTLYVGLGFAAPLSTIRWDDGCGYDKARELDPSITDPHEYDLTEKALRGECLRLFFTKPFFVLAAIAAKVGVLPVLLLKYAHLFFIALLLFFYFGTRNTMNCFDGAFLLQILFNSFYPLVAVPYVQYMVGMISAVVLYGIFIINRDLLTLMVHRMQRSRSSAIS